MSRFRSSMQFQALVVSLFFVLAMAAGAFYFLGDELKERFIGNVPDLTAQKDAVVTLAQKYIKEFAAYDQTKNIPLVFEQAKQLDVRHWVVTFLSTAEQQAAKYQYIVELINEQVVKTDVLVTDPSGTLTIYSPQPQEVISSQAVLVKGWHVPGVEKLDLSLVNEKGRVSAQMEAAVGQNADGQFTVTLEVGGLSSGPYTLKVEGSNQVLEIPVIISQ